jgi:hypothetical protein
MNTVFLQLNPAGIALPDKSKKSDKKRLWYLKFKELYYRELTDKPVFISLCIKNKIKCIKTYIIHCCIMK